MAFGQAGASRENDPETAGYTVLALANPRSLAA